MNCTERCPECPSRGLELGAKPVVSGDWNDGPYNIVFVGEAPGKEENNRRRVFVGKTGEEFNNTYLPLAGLSRSEVSMTNTVKCHWADSSDAPPDALVRSCSEFHLRKELALHKPDYVVLMGGTANSLLNLDVEFEHGMVRSGSLLGWSGTIFSTFHPALGLHKSDKMLQMIDKLDGDFPRLKRVLRGQLHELKDNCETHFRRLTNSAATTRILNDGIRRGCDIAVDTESKKSWRGYPSTIKYTPWCATFAMWPGEAFMVRVGDDSFMDFARAINRFRRIIFHNSAYDHEILRLAGCEVDWDRSQDTMQMAYDDGRVPKGLKALSYRLLGKRMTSFDDTVIPHSWERVIDYLERAMNIQWPKRVQESTGEYVTKKCPECKGNTVLTLGRGKLKRFYECDCGDGFVTVPRMTRRHGIQEKLNLVATAVRKNGRNVDLWERWNQWAEADPVGIRDLIDRCGPMPLPSIEYVPESEAIEYACGDAHETLRLFPIMKRRLIDVRRSMNKYK